MNTTTFIKDLERLINKHSIDNKVNTPDFILAEHVVRCIAAFGATKTNANTWANEGFDPGWAPETFDAEYQGIMEAMTL